MRGQKVDWEGAEQRTASMPRGLAAAFIVFAFIVFLWCSSKAFFLQQQLYAAQKPKRLNSSTAATNDD